MTISESRPLFSAARWSELRRLLDELAEVAAEDREQRLIELGRDDAELASALRELLAEASDTATRSPERIVARLAPEPTDDAPLRIGPFRLLHRIGAGGMGVIYLAERERVDFVQQVALKLLDGGSARLARLAARERRILAALAHPNITAFVDAGSIDGRAWMAMEYVDGEPLLDYCRHANCDVRERVRLFDQICAAVAHAHAQLVVHRDLKPSNILVNSNGIAKLLDFGIALMLDPAEESEPATRVFTPEYAAPEQLRGERASTATDIYSLGLILFELVAGHRLPTLDNRIGVHGWSTAELVRYTTTRESQQDPQAPRSADSDTIRKLLRGDLGRIIAHALNSQPIQRYASVTALRDDVARWLDFRPLGIRRPTLGYVARRFVQRHRFGTAFATLGVAGMLALGGTAFWQAREKLIEAERAKVALRQAEATRDFMTSLFFSADPLMGKGMQATAGELVKAARERIDTQLADQPDVAAELLFQIGNVYVSDGDEAATRETLGKAIAYNQRRAKPSAIIEGSSQTRLAFMDFLASKSPADWQRLEGAIAQLRAAGQEARPGLADALGMYGNLLYNEGRADEAIAADAESVEILASLGESAGPDYVTALLTLADLYASTDRNQQAMDTADTGLAHPHLKTGAGEALRSELLGVRARGLTGLRRYKEAEAVMAEVVRTGIETRGLEHFSIRYWRYRRAQLLDGMGRLVEAREEIDRLLEVPSTGGEQPIAQIAHRVTRLAINIQLRSDEAKEDVGPALAGACGEIGNAQFCAKARLLAAELAILHPSVDSAGTALRACANDATISGNPAMSRRLKLLNARQARVTGETDSAKAQLDALRAEAELSDAERAQLDLERGYLALAMHDSRQAIEALEAARNGLSADLSEKTPEIKEIEAALASTNRNL